MSKKAINSSCVVNKDIKKLLNVVPTVNNLIKTEETICTFCVRHINENEIQSNGNKYEAEKGSIPNSYYYFDGSAIELAARKKLDIYPFLARCHTRGKNFNFFMTP